MKNNIWLLLFLAGMLTMGAFAAEVIVLKVNVEAANLRTAPNISSTIVKQVLMGTLLEARTKLGTWYEVAVTDDTGATVIAYISSSFVELVTGEAAPPQEIPEPARKPVQQAAPPPPPSQGPNVYPVSTYASSSGAKILGGLALSNISYSDISQTDLNDYQKSKMGFLGGIGFEQGARMSFEINLLYIQKGVKFEGQLSEQDYGFDGNFNLTNVLNEISMPVLLKYRLMPGSTPYILAGGEVAYVLSNKIDYSITNETTDQTVSDSEDGLENTKRIDYGLVFGGGFELISGQIPIFFEARYHLGLANLANPGEDFVQAGEDDWVKTSLFAFLVGIKF